MMIMVSASIIIGGLPVHLYDLHGILRVASNEPLTRLTRFKVSALRDPPEITIRFGGFTPDLRGYRRIGRCWVEDRSLFCEDWYKICRFKLWMRGIDSGHTAIFFDGDPLFSREVFYVLIFEPYLTKKLSRFGALLLHAASLEVGGRGYLVSGLTGTGKTTLLLKLLNLVGAKYLSDDQSIIKGGDVLCYPMPIGFRGHLLRSSGVGVGLADRLNIAFGDAVNLATNSYGNYTHRVAAEKITLPNGNPVEVGKSAPVKAVFLLNLCRDTGLTRVSPDDAAALLMEHNQRNEDKQKLLFRFFTKYRAVYPEFDYWERYEGLVKRFAESGAEFYRVDIAERYAVEKVVKDMINVIQND